MKIEGVYKFFQDGKCIGEHKNNITETGRILAIKTIMGAVPSFGGSIHLGVDGSLNTYTYTPTQIVVSGTSPSQSVVLTVPSHTLSVGTVISFRGITATGITGLNGTSQTVTATTSTTVTLVSATSLTNGTYSTAGTIGNFGNLATNTRLGFRVSSTPVLSSNIDNTVSYDAILFKAKFEDPSEYKIYEAGLYSNALIGGGTSSRNELLISFEPGQIVLDSTGADLPTSGATTRFLSTTESSNFRIGSNALQVIVGTAAKTASGFNLSNSSETDVINLAFYANGNGAANVVFHSGSSTATYTFTVTGGAGYYVMSALRNSVAPTGAMDWSNISKIVFSATTSTMIFDGLRIEPPSVVDTLNGLVSRTALTTPITKGIGSPLDIEYHMRLSFNG